MSSSWYVRRGTKVKGPFPDEVIARFLAQDRLRETDDISVDMKCWQPLAHLKDTFAHRDSAGTAGEENRPQPPGTDGAQARPTAFRSRPGQVAISEGSSVGASHRRPRRRLINRYVDKVSTRDRRQPFHLAILAVMLSALVLVGINLTPPTAGSRPQCEARPSPGVDWSNCTLEFADLTRANLSGANLRSARMREAQLMGAKLLEADLGYAELIRVQFAYADLRGASLFGASLVEADLSNARLDGANLAYADLTGANLGGASLVGTRLDDAKWTDARVCAPGSVSRCLFETPANASTN